VRSADGGPILALVVLGLALPLGCNEGPAREALAEAETTLASVRSDLERHAPETLARLERELSTARDALAEGRYTDALRTAQELSEGIREGVDRAATRRGVLEATWEELSGTVPGRLGCLRACLREIASGQPGSAVEPRVQGAVVHLGSLEGTWTGASEAFERGDLRRAVSEARTVDASIGELSESLGCAPGC
jgi:hypothetical protein